MGGLPRVWSVLFRFGFVVFGVLLGFLAVSVVVLGVALTSARSDVWLALLGPPGVVRMLEVLGVVRLVVVVVRGVGLGSFLGGLVR